MELQIKNTWRMRNESARSNLGCSTELFIVNYLFVKSLEESVPH